MGNCKLAGSLLDLLKIPFQIEMVPVERQAQLAQNKLEKLKQWLPLAGEDNIEGWGPFRTVGLSHRRVGVRGTSSDFCTGAVRH